MWSSRRPCSLPSAISLFDQAMHGVEGAGVLDPQSGQRVDVEKAPVVDVAGGEPPVAELVVLAFQQTMQRKGLRGAIRSGPIGGEPARDDLGAAGDAFNSALKAGASLRLGWRNPL